MKSPKRQETRKRYIPRAVGRLHVLPSDFHKKEGVVIYLDGHDLRDVKQRSLRNNIGIVLQGHCCSMNRYIII